MKKINIDGLDEVVTYEKLDNGLDVYVAKKENYNSFSAYFVTNYGALIDNFVPINEKDMHKFPHGIAHFLEHKLFEQEEGPSVLEKFSSLGGNCNAFTNYNFTTYYATGTDNVLENILFLLDYVQSPYFTDENVEKEKGIIKQEALMNKDDPYREFYYKILSNLFVNYEYGKSLVGEFSDIESINKEDLYRCYNTFYNPSNMAFIVVSNLDPEEVINEIKNNQDKKHFDKMKEITKEEKIEPETTYKEYEVIYGDVAKIEISYNIKMPFSKFDYEWRDTIKYLNILLKMNFSKISGFSLDLKKKNIINNDIDVSVHKYDDYVVLSIDASGDNEKEIIKLIEDKLNNLTINEEDFNRIKKSMISNIVYSSSSVDGSMNMLYTNYCNNGKILPDSFMKYKNLNVETLKNVYESLDLKNKTIVVMKPLNKKE